jgi:streptogramin lyase
MHRRFWLRPPQPKHAWMALSGLILALLGADLAGVAGGQVITEFDIPTANRLPGSIAAGPDGNLWFVEAEGSQIGRITPTGAIVEFPLPSTFYPGLVDITAGPDGNLWFPDGSSYDGAIGRLTTSGLFTSFPIPTPNAHPEGIAVGPDGNLWFTERDKNQIGRITTAGVVTEFEIPTANGEARGIAAGPDGNLWFTEYDANKIGRITTAGVITEFAIPTADSSPWKIAAGPDGNLWFTETGSDTIGQITTAGVVTEFAMYAYTPLYIVAGPDGNLWFTVCCSYRIGRITTDGVVTLFDTPMGAQTRGIAAGPDGNIWFTEDYGNRIGRITIASAGSCVAGPFTHCLNANRFKVEVSWSVPSQGRSGLGIAAPLTSDTGYFWFFNSDNVELVIKVLDGRTYNGYYWVFYGALSNVQYTITVTDTVTGAVKTYENPAGTMASVADTSAFTPPAASSDSPETASEQEIDTRSAEELYGLYAAMTDCPTRPKAAAADPCTPGGTTLCLDQSRFQVSVDWEVPSQGRSGHGMAVPITSDTGYFWFFNSDNVELVIKALDGRTYNGHYWVFYGALSNVHYTITVTDTQTGLVKTYDNPSGTLASVADTTAF